MKKPKVHLFDGSLTLGQQLILLLWGALLVSVVALWAPLGLQLLAGGPGEQLLAIGQLLGLLATFFALTQFMLMGRIGWVERHFGLDRLASYHRFNGYMAIALILLHPLFITLHHVAVQRTDIVTAYLSIFPVHPYTAWALVAEILFVSVVASSIYIARKHLKFETWYFVHLMVYAAIVLASLHQFANGGSLLASPFAMGYWYALYGFVALNLLIWRFGLPVYNFFKFDFRISRVEFETPTVTSVYIKARGLHRLRYLPGQFVLVRIFMKGLWWQEHPFSVSWIPHGDELRLSIRNVGDYTAAIQHLKPGARVALSGPFGRFTRQVAVTPKRLFIVGGIGITPVRALLEEADTLKLDSVLLYANRTPADVPLKKEIDKLSLANSRVSYVYSDETVKGAVHGQIDGELIQKLVPDFKERDVYLCGPPPMMAGLVQDLTERGLKLEQLHYEVFALHP